MGWSRDTVKWQEQTDKPIQTMHAPSSFMLNKIHYNSQQTGKTKK